MMQKRDSLIERYLEGRMTAPEERMFRNRLEQDQQLLEMLRTELLIRSTMAAERGRPRTAHDRTRTRAMAMLAAMPRGTEAAASAGSTGGILSGLAGIKGIVAALAVAAATAGSYMAFVPSGTAEPPPATAPAYRGAATPEGTELPPQPAPVAAPAPLPNAATVEPEPSETAHTSAQRNAPASEPARPSGQAATAPPAVSSEAEEKSPEETTIPEVPEQPAAAVRETNEPPVTIRNDTLRTRLKIESMQRP